MHTRRGSQQKRPWCFAGTPTRTVRNVSAHEHPRSPQPGLLQDYIEIVTRMNQTIAFGSLEMGAVETVCYSSASKDTN